MATSRACPERSRRDNALKGRRFDGLAELDSHLKRWNRTVARLRVHGTTRKQVYSHFLEVDQPALRALPQGPFNLFNVGTQTVHPDGHIQVEGAFYSVPHTLVGTSVGIHWDDRLIRVYGQGKCLAVHSRALAGTFLSKDFCSCLMCPRIFRDKHASSSQSLIRGKLGGYASIVHHPTTNISSVLNRVEMSFGPSRVI